MCREDRARIMELVIRLIKVIPSFGILEAPPGCREWHSSPPYRRHGDERRDARAAAAAAPDTLPTAAGRERAGPGRALTTALRVPPASRGRGGEISGRHSAKGGGGDARGGARDGARDGAGPCACHRRRHRRPLRRRCCHAQSTKSAVVSTYTVGRIRIRSRETETTTFLIWEARRYGHSAIHLGGARRVERAELSAPFAPASLQGRSLGSIHHDWRVVDQVELAKR